MKPVLQIGVIIPTWNRAALLAAALHDLAAQTHPIARIVVVDNGSSDDSAELAAKMGAFVVRLRRNEGFAYAVNRGIEECRTDWVLILNNDVRFGPEWLAALAAGRTANDWFATGKLLMQNEPETLDGTFDAISRGGTAWRCGHGRPDGPLWNAPRKIQFAPLTAALFRRELFNHVGLLDERLESYLEDLDLGLRCAAAGLTGIYVPAAVATHQGSATLGAWHKATVRLMARNQTLLIRKHFKGAPLWPILVAHVLWGAVAMRRNTGWQWFRGKLDGFAASIRSEDAGWPAIRDAVVASEADLARLQRTTGPDLYWRLYFALVRTETCLT